MTVLKKYKGLISWSGTAFEYIMPNINNPRYEGSLLDESCRFAIMNQIENSQKLGIPWGISEAAFNLKDLDVHSPEIQDLINKLSEMIDQTNFRVLYSEEQRLFSIGYNIEENKLTDSYYDLLASEARQAS